MAVREVFDGATGVLVETWDDDARTFTDHRPDPDETRPYTAQENAQLDADLTAQAEAQAHEETGNAVTAIIEDMKAERDAMQAIIDKPNEEIEGAVAFNIKEVARSAKKMASAEIDLAKYVKGL